MEETCHKNEIIALRFSSNHKNQAVPEENIVPIFKITETLLVEDKGREESQKQDKVGMLRKKYKGIMDIEQPIDDNEQVSAGMSAYSRYNRSREGPSSRPRPMTAGTLLPLREGMGRGITSGRAEMIEEVYMVRTALGRKKVACSIESLKKALIMAEDLPPQMMSYKYLPRPGSGLLSKTLFSGKAKKNYGGKLNE